MRLRSTRDTDIPPVSPPQEKTVRTIRKPSDVATRKQAAILKTVHARANGEPAKKKRKTEGNEEMAVTNAPSTSAPIEDVEEIEEEKRVGRAGRKRKRLIVLAQGAEKNIGDLPAHIMIDIFSLLPIIDRVKVERVCRRWNNLAKGYSWSQTETFSYSTLVQETSCTQYRYTNERPIIGNIEVKSLARRFGRHIRNLDLHAFRDTLTYNVCSSFATICPNLVSLNLCGIQLTNSSVQLLGRHCFLLEDVNFHRCFQESVVERGLSSFFSKCNRLKVVDVGENERLSGIPSFSLLPSTVETLKIGGCYRLTGESMEAVKSRCPNLSYLVMSSVDTLTATELNNFFSSLENLRKLRFGECFISHSIGGADLNLGRLKNLTELSINDNLLITDRVLRTVVNGCKQLKYVDVSGCNRFVTNEGLLELAKLPHLTHLNLSLMRVTNDATVKKFAEKGILQALLLHRCDEITDESIMEILRNCQDLNALDVSFCPKVTDATLEAMHEFVMTREKREETQPYKNPPARRDDLISQMIRHERTLQSLMDADFERHILRFENVRFRFDASTHRGTFSTRRGDKKKKEECDNPNGYTPLQVWVGHSGITQPCDSKHYLLKINDKDSLAEHSSSVFELRLVVTIN